MNPQPAGAVSDGCAALESDAGSRVELDAFEALMRLHNRRLFRVARSIVRSDIEAEDVLQDAYLMAYRCLHQFRGDARLSTWLTRIVINQALAHLRKHRREGRVFAPHSGAELEQVPPESRLASGGLDGPEADAMRGELRALLETGIDRLPAAYRTVFVLRAIEELSVEETAACLGIPEPTVRTRFFRARNLLREALQSRLDLALKDIFRFDGARCDRIVLAVRRRLDAELAGR